MDGDPSGPAPARIDDAPSVGSVPPWARRDTMAAAAVAAFSAVIAATHGLLGPNYVLDDYWILDQAVFDGVFGASDPSLTAARPGTPLAYAVTFGLFGNHPLPVFLVQTVINLLIVVALYAVLRRFLAFEYAVPTTALWVFLPNHVSLEIWPTTSTIALSLLLLLVGVLVLARPSPSRAIQAVGLACFCVASLFYEASIPVAAALVVAIPWLVERRLRFGFIAAGAAVLGANTLWLVTHWHDVKGGPREVADLSQALPAHFGWGVVPVGPLASVLLAVALVGIALVAGRAVLHRRLEYGPAEGMVLVGAAVIAVGVIPFATYLYAPLGAGDRFNYVTAIGGALVWVGLAALAWRYRALVVVGAAALLIGAGLARWERTQLWDRAGNDAVAILALTKERIPEPDQAIMFGPRPIQEENVAAFLDHSNVRGAVRVLYGDKGADGFISFSEDDFESHDPRYRIDMNEVSTLEPDSVIHPGGD